MIKLTLNNIEEHLSKFNKIIVTGPARAGTTISGLIISNVLRYKFIDETWYDGGDSNKFMSFMFIDRKLVIHTTAFLRDLHEIPEFFKMNKIPIVLVKRKIEDILKSFKNSIKFGTSVTMKKGLFRCFDDEAQKTVLRHYGKEEGVLPEVIYNHFYKHMHKLSNVFYINYEDLKAHELFIDKKIRRENFVHLKQIKMNPNYLNQGVMVL